MGMMEARVRYPAPTLDRMLHVLRYLYDGQGRWVPTFSGHVDADRMARAFRLVLDTEPVLGCRFVDHPWRPYWERLPDGKLASPMRVIEGSDDATVHAWLAAPHDPSSDVQVRACLFRGSDRDRLGITLSHEVSDATGNNDYLSLVGRIYRELGANPGYRPPPRREKRLGQGPVLRNAGLRRVLRGCRHFSTPPPGFKSPAESLGVPAFASRSIGPVGLSGIREYARKRGVTVQDVVFAAFYRSQFRMFSASPESVLTIPIPIDLRRFLPRESKCSICNLFATFFGGVHNRDLEELVLDVHRLMASARSNEPFLGQALIAELLFMLPYGLIRRIGSRVIGHQIASGNVYPYITNYGVLDSSRFDFGDAAICDFEIWDAVPSYHLGNFAVYTIADTMRATVSTRDRPGGGKAEEMLETFLRELPTEASPMESTATGRA